jgi:hypothetical protein
MELNERQEQKQTDDKKKSIIQLEKERLLKEHADVLNQFYGKAASQFGTANLK